MKIVGITGGIGSGKSYVARLLATNYRVPVYDCDSEARRLMLGPAIREQLVRLIGPKAYTADGQLNKPVVASFLFANAEHAAAVNGIVHPVVKADFAAWATRQGTPVVLVESAILIEAGFLDVVDHVVLVDAPLDLRISRAMQRDGATREQVEARIRHQLPSSEQMPYADVVVCNDGSPIMPQLRFFMAQMFAQSV